MRTLLIATNNPGKVRELRALLSELHVALKTPDELGLQLEVIEDGATYIENARKKAAAFAAASGLPSLADDSGLEVALLGGAPGLHSARYAGRPEASDGERRALLLTNLRGKSRPWKARFQSAVALAIPKGEIRHAEGECPGEIIPQERGSHGFGYDPVFLVQGTGLTMAELSMDQKNRLSHRARAVMNAMPFLHEMLAG